MSKIRYQSTQTNINVFYILRSFVNQKSNNQPIG